VLFRKQRELFCFLIAVVAGAQPYDGGRIASIQFSPAEQPMPVVELLQLLPLKPGDTYSGVALREAMAVLYRTGRFSNLTVEATRSNAGLELTFLTESNEFNGNVDVVGMPGPVTKGSLINAAKLPLGALFDPGLLTQSVESVESELRSEGYYESQVRYELSHDTAHQQVNIRFFVEPGPRARFSTPILKGNPILTAEQVIRATHWRRFLPTLGWRYVSEQRVQSGIRGILNIYRKREFLMAKVQVERLEYQKAKRIAIPSLKIDVGPKVQVRAIGQKISTSTLRKLVPIYEEQSIDRDLLMEGTRNITTYLHSKGFFDATVISDVEQDAQAVDDIDPSKDTFVDYHINPGRRYKVAALRLTGNAYFADDALLERIAVRPATILRYRQGRYSDELLAGDRNSIEELYRSNGFLGVKVSSEVTRQHKGNDDLVSISIHVEEGQQTRIEAIRLEGIADSDRPVLEGYISATPGQPYSLITINGDRDRILNLLYQTGFSEAVLDIRIETGSTPDQVVVVYNIKGGSQHFVREVIITGLGATDPSLVAKRIRLKPGDPLSNTEVYASQRRLYDLGIFARVDTAQQNPEGQEISKTILFNLEEASRWSFNGGLGAEIARIGGGITSFDSPAGGAGFSPRVSLGANRANFLGLGHTIGAQTRISNIQKRVLLSYLAPQFRDSDHFSLTATTLYDDARNVRTYNSKRLEGSLQLAQRVDLANSLQYRFTYRRVTIDENTIKVAPSLIPLLAQPVRVGSFSSTFIQDRRDDPVDAKRGRYTTVDFGVASKAFASSTNFLRLLMRNSGYYKIGKDLVFARSINFGILTPYQAAGLTSQTDIPLPERFFSGGAYSHRGFPENQAGPRDLTTGFPLGGKALLVNNLELRFPLIGDNLGGVFFHDAGNVYSDIKRVNFKWSQNGLTDFDYMVHSIGFGVRYRTPIGPVRVDLALTPNSPRFNGFEGSREDLLFGRGRAAQLRVSQFQFHISLGQAF
jgi:outer membrane protein insertion porin family